MEEQTPSYNIETVGVIYKTELQEHLNDMKQLNKHLSEVTSIFRQGTMALDQEGKKDKIEEMKEYIEQALASIAYSTTHATQKIDDGLKMQAEDIDNVARQVKEISLQAEMKKEMKNRLTMGELSAPKRKPNWSTIKVVDDPHSHWKVPPARYRRQELDFKILDHVGITGVDSNKVVDDQNRRTSRSLSIGSQQFRNTMTRSSTGRTEEGRNMGTLKRAAMPMPVLSKPKIKSLPKENPLPEEEEIPVEIQNKETPFDSPPVVKRTPKLEIAIPESSDDLSPPLSSSESHTSNQTPNMNYRLSNLPAIPDDFMTDIFASLNQESTIIEEEIEQIQMDREVPSYEDFMNPFDDLPPPPSEFDFDVSTLPPPPPPPPGS